MKAISFLLAIGAATPTSALSSWRRAAGDITVDLSKTYQTMDGFGCSFAFQRANLITNMSDKTKQRQLLDLLFNTTTGAGLSIVRNGIGSSPDSSSDHMNTFAPTNPGGPKAAPRDSWDGRDSGQLFVSQEAYRTYGVRTIYGDAWSAPGYMKSNGNENNGGTLCGVSGTSCQSGDWRQAYADYLVRYVKYYADAGVPVTHLGFLNEPEFAASYASMSSSGAQAADMIKVLSSTLQAANLSSQVGIACCESEGWGNQVNMLNAIKSAGAEALLRTVTSHTYTGGSSSPMNTKVPVWLSEQCDLNGQWTASWYASGGAGEGLTWANNIYAAVVNTQVSGYLYWEGVQWPDPNTNEKMIKVAKTAPYDYEVSKRLWAFANWSRFVRPGAVRVGSSGGSGVKSAAFRNVDGSVAVVVISTGGSASAVSVRITGFTPTTASAWVTDAAHNCAETNVTVADGSVVGTVAARSITTFFIPGQAAAAATPTLKPLSKRGWRFL
ncbi:glycoside hydrolase family 30 protein [Truncatella angustata]|uniref:Glycoside hydrolase family 30 protein n=1 Tax=Truncatella angustata TaxID=152316 RepID=A0A9P8ULZ8_9PEZI|nr:glycoside hydrolase family 30 protein [Truncatella angustata]KAH6654563.1 glycoside hydrolase family 30 protein [Truncatella angustata]